MRVDGDGIGALEVRDAGCDALGQANRMVASAADEVILMVSGIPVVVKGAAVSPTQA